MSTVTAAWLASSVKSVPVVAPKRKVSVPAPTTAALSAKAGLASVCDLAREKTSSEYVPDPEVPTGLDAVATLLLTTLGRAERSPVRTRSPKADARMESEFLIEEAAEICRSSCSPCVTSRSLRRAKIGRASCMYIVYIWQYDV